MQNSLVAERIKLLCKEKSITIKSLLEKCHINKGFIYDLEKKAQAPSVDKLDRIADALGVSMDYLLGKTDTKKDPAPEEGDEVAEVARMVSRLSPDNRAKLMELIHLFLDAQRNNE